MEKETKVTLDCLLKRVDKEKIEKVYEEDVLEIENYFKEKENEKN